MSLDIFELIVDEERERIIQYHSDRIAQKRPPMDHYMTRMRRLNGEEFPVNFILRQITYHGRPAVMCITIDVSEQLEAEKTIRQRESYLSALVEIQNILLNSSDLSANCFKRH